MSTFVIDTIKPKNGLDFPVVEAIDVAVEGYSSLADAVTHFATDTAIVSINTALEGKASNSDIANLQGQINQIEISASAEAVVAPEVAAARVGADSTEYETLKERLDGEQEKITEDIEDVAELVFDTKNTSLTRNIFMEKGSVIPESFINAAGEEKRSGTGTGNNWVSGFIRVPTGKVIHIISPLATISVAAYSADKSFDRFVVGTASELRSAGEHTFTSTVPFIRLSFYNANGFTDEKYDNARVFYRVSDEQLAESENIVDSFSWTLCVPGPNGMNFSAETIGVDQLIVCDKPMLLERLDSSYSMAVAYIDPDDYTHTTNHTWFLNTVDRITIPANAPFYLGLRKNDITNQELPETISNIISLTECSNTLLFGVASAAVFNGISFRNFSATSHRVAKPDMQYADEDMLLRVTNKESIYTLIMCTDTEVDYFSENWSAIYSDKISFIIPKGTWYNYSTCYISNDTEYGTQEMAQEMYEAIEIVPVSKLEYNSFGLQSSQSQLSSLLRRINALEAINNIDLVPSYYEQHLTDKIAEIKRHSADTRFIFITDIHYNGYNNAKHSKALMTRICNEISSIKHVVHGGDLVNTGTSYTKEDIIRNLNVAADYIRPDAHVRYHSVFGNHDTGEDYPGGVKLPAKLTADEYAVAASAGLSYADEAYDPLNCTQYYFDDGDVRFIVLNANLRELTGETYTNTWRFLARSLISADNKTIVVINHIIRGSNNNLPPFTQTIFDALDAYNAREPFTYSGAAFDFSGASGRAAIVIGGHLHKDEDLTTTGGIPVVIVTTDNAGAELPSGIERTIGTTTEQAFDVFSVDTAGRKVYATRIGAGNDRIYEF